MKWSKIESQLIHGSLMNWTIDDDDDDDADDGEVQARSNWNPSWFLFPPNRYNVWESYINEEKQLNFILIMY